ncbi:exo1 [Symbiodinium necroappetens]|uniref:Exo1 protein n=1 Tax=Symbiodinium necroappetens TaxID=1628268 RepID=A0A812XDP5_9DINO|nr:exo1 [Symbiodinium necroappetens]
MARLAPLEDKRAWPALGPQPDQGGEDHERHRWHRAGPARMGIQGLLKALEDVQRECHVKEFAGKRAAVDAHGWLHAALAGSAVDVELEVDDQIHVRYCAKRISMLRRFGVEPVFVFDGAALPAKAALLQERRQRRERMRREGELRLSEGDFAQAKSCLAQAVEIKDHQIDDVVRLLAAEEVRYIHAPCEADAQMAYLAWHGYVDFCISEDSDLLALGSPRVLYKLRGDGHGREIILDDALNGRSLEDFQAICILMGCDYLPRLRGVGPALAVQVVAARGREAEAVARELRVLGITVPSEYAEHFRLASKVLQLQPVYEPRSGRQIPLWSSQEPHAVPVQLASHTGTSAPQETDALVPMEAPRGRARRKGSLGRSRSRTPGREGGRGSAFVSDSFEQARSTQQGAMTLEEFIRRERAERTGSSRGGEHGDGDLASPALSVAGKSRFFGRQHSKLGSLWSD